MPSVIADISNYDFDEDVDEPAWASEFIAAGIAGVIVGSQWPDKAHAQLVAAKAAGLPIIGTYAEPDVESAIALALEFGATRVGLACERGSILTYDELARDVELVRAAGLTPWIYGNRGDLITIAGSLLESCDVWLANYGMNDPANPRDPITEMNFGYGPKKLVAHQFSSTIVVAGRNRDHSYFFGAMEEDMTKDETITLICQLFLPLLEQAIGTQESTFSDTEAIARVRAALKGGGSFDNFMDLVLGGQKYRVPYSS